MAQSDVGNFNTGVFVVQEVGSFDTGTRTAQSKKQVFVTRYENLVSLGYGYLCYSFGLYGGVLTVDYEREFSDGINISDFRFSFPQKYLSDGLSISDVFDSLLTATIVFSENIGISDNVSKGLSRELSDGVSVSDSIIKTAFKEFSDIISVTDDFDTLFVMFLDLVDSLNITENATFGVSKSLEDNINVVDNFSRVYNAFLELNDSVNALDSFVKGVGKELKDEVSIVENILRTFQIFLEDTINVLANIETGTQFGLLLEDTLNVKDRLCFNEITKVIFSIKKDFEDVLYDLMKEQVNLIKLFTDREGSFVEDVSQKTFCIDCRIVPISQKDREMIPLDKVTTGQMTGYFLPKYAFEGDIYEVEENDEIYDSKNDVRYRVISIIQREHLNTEVIYIKALLRRI